MTQGKKKSLDFIAQEIVDCYNELVDFEDNRDFTQGALKAYLNILGFNKFDEFRQFYEPTGRLYWFNPLKRKNFNEGHWAWKGKTKGIRVTK